MESNKKEEKKTKKSNKIKLIISDFKGEFKKIVWPKPKELVKQTYTVIVTCFVFGIVICLMDAVYAYCLNLFINLIS